jgi:hypothetical protein
MSRVPHSQQQWEEHRPRRVLAALRQVLVAEGAPDDVLALVNGPGSPELNPAARRHREAAQLGAGQP